MARVICPPADPQVHLILIGPHLDCGRHLEDISMIGCQPRPVPPEYRSVQNRRSARSSGSAMCGAPAATFGRPNRVVSETNPNRAAWPFAALLLRRCHWSSGICWASSRAATGAEPRLSTHSVIVLHCQHITGPASSHRRNRRSLPYTVSPVTQAKGAPTATAR